jgi:hypothetical protein
MKMVIEINNWTELKEMYTNLTEMFGKALDSNALEGTSLEPTPKKVDAIKEAIESQLLSNKPPVETPPEPEAEAPKPKPKRKRRTKAQIAADKAAEDAAKAAAETKAAEPEETKPELTLEMMRAKCRTMADTHGEQVVMDTIKSFKGVGLAELASEDYQPLALLLDMKRTELEKSSD